MSRLSNAASLWRKYTLTREMGAQYGADAVSPGNLGDGYPVDARLEERVQTFALDITEIQNFCTTPLY